MKKYYIPTSSLNFNNILSTESISPKIFYDHRGFGYTRWFTVEENDIEEVTLLYSTPHTFTRPGSDLEDHPMLIEINTNEEFQQLSEDVFYTDKTIYLNPWETMFHFFSEKVKQIVLSMSDGSLETKMLRLYRRKMIVSAFEGEYAKPRDVSLISANNFSMYIEEDYILNKMKGLLYGYYIGANLSISSNQVNQLKALREIRDIFLSVRSSNDRQPSESQRKRLYELFLQIECYHPIYRDIEREFENEDSGMIERIFNFIKRHFSFAFKQESLGALVSELKSDKEPNSSLSWIEGEITKLNREMTSERSCLNPDKAEIIVSSKHGLVSQKALEDNLMANLMKHWVNRVFCSRSFNGKVSAKKEELSDEITTTAKEIFGDRWDESYVRTYLNLLRRHIRGHEFNQPWDNGLLSSVAAVLIKGDDWESLLCFMQSKGMYDYRLAFAIYGALNGFANMTRDFTDKILNEEDRIYLRNLYCEFYEQLHEKGILRRTEEIEGNNSLDSTLIRKNKIPLLASDNDNKWAMDVRRYAKEAVKTNKEKLLFSLESALRENGDNRNYDVFFEKLSKYEGWRTSKNKPSESMKRLRELLRSNENSKKNHNPGLFDNNNMQQPNNMPINSHTQKSILRDKKWIEQCANMITNSGARKQFIEDAEWFVDNHKEYYYDKKKGQQKGCYFGGDQSNHRVIEKFKHYLRKTSESNREDMKWLVEKYREIPIDKIIDKISEMYDI